MPFSRFEEFQAYQPQVAQMLSNGFLHDRLSHAYIFEGPRGTKKSSAAFFFAKRLLCRHPDPEGNPCGECADCLRIEKGTHPNVFFIRPDGEYIKVEQIRSMIAELSRTAMEDAPRVYVVEEADRMRAEAANALLKTLEEPGSDIYAVLLTDKFNSLLKTIVSRSHVMHFQPLDKALVRKDLLSRGVEVCLASVIPEYTNNFEEALAIAESPDMSDIFCAVPGLYGKAGKANESLVLSFREIRDRVFVTTEMTDFFLTLLILYQKDILHCKQARSSEVVWKPELAKMQQLASLVSDRWIEGMLEKMLSLKTRLKFNIVDSLAFDNLLVNLERGFLHAA